MNKKKKILIVEDDSLVGADLTHTLTGYGYQVAGPITSGEEVLEQIHEISPDFILMDINLSGKLDGIKTTEALQKEFQAPVVFLSALNDETTLQRAKLVQPYGYLIKPFDQLELKSTIDATFKRYDQVKKDHNFITSDDYSDKAYSDTTIDISEYFSKLKVFNEISPDSINELAKSCLIKEVNAGEFIIHEGQKSEGGFIPLTGRVSITKSSSSGKELIVALIAPGDIYGLFSLLTPLSKSTSAKTQIDSKCIWIPIREWKYFIEKEQKIYKNLTEALSERLNASHMLSSSLAHARVEARIISTLLALLPDFGKSTSKNSNDGRIFITRKELSELTGTTPETAIRVTKALERQSLLDLTRPGIIKIPDVMKLEKSGSF